MAHVKLDTLIKDFVVNVLQGLPAHTVRKVIDYKTVKWTPCHMIIKKHNFRTETGNRNETMFRKSWDVKEFIGQYAQVRLVDKSSGDWGHIKFDDLKGDIICPHYLDDNN